ncbi:MULTISPECIES: tail fiber assembly protein [unclassified Caballeronia]|uniref:tail fiber assembly protein n=1 Tax=unclassified Caballeronia TaxID=2646786 RepID=UPI002027DB2B|nr:MULTISPECIES: tail fiber assembly protein [unclassified Caballeronia]
MKTYAQVIDGRVQEVIPPETYEAPDPALQGQIDPDLWLTIATRAGSEIPLEARFTPEFCASCVDITDLTPPPAAGWLYDGSSFSPYVPPVPTPAEILATNTTVRDALLANAALVIAPLQDAVDLEVATDAETALLRQWKQYRVAVNRLDLTAQNVAWPTTPA